MLDFSFTYSQNMWVKANKGWNERFRKFRNKIRHKDKK